MGAYLHLIIASSSHNFYPIFMAKKWKTASSILHFFFHPNSVEQDNLFHRFSPEKRIKFAINGKFPFLKS